MAITSVYNNNNNAARIAGTKRAKNAHKNKAFQSAPAESQPWPQPFPYMGEVYTRRRQAANRINNESHGPGEWSSNLKKPNPTNPSWVFGVQVSYRLDGAGLHSAQVECFCVGCDILRASSLCFCGRSSAGMLLERNRFPRAMKSNPGSCGLCFGLLLGIKMHFN